MSLLQGYSSESDSEHEKQRVQPTLQLPQLDLIAAPEVTITSNDDMIAGALSQRDASGLTRRSNFGGELQDNYISKADFELQHRFSQKRKPSKVKHKRAKRSRTTADDFDYKGPWGGSSSDSDAEWQKIEVSGTEEHKIEVSGTEEHRNEVSETEEHEEQDHHSEAEDLGTDDNYVLGYSDVTTEFLGKSKRDYLGRTYMHIPRDLDVNLMKEPGTQECFVPKKIIHTYKGHSKGITKLELFPRSGHLLLSASNDGKIYLWDIYHKRELLRGFYGHSQAVKDITFNNDGSRFLSCGYDKKIVQWDTESGKILHTIKLRSMPNVIKYHPLKNNEFIVGLTNHKIEHYDLDAVNFDSPIQTYDHHLGAINSLTVIDEGNRFMSTSDDKTVRFWDWQINIPVKFISDPSQHSMPFAAIYPTEKFIALQSMDNSISVIQGHGKYKFNKKKYFTGHNVAGYGIGIDFTPDGKILMSGDSKGYGVFWDWKTCRIITKLKVSEKYINCIKAHPQESSKVVMAGASGNIYFCD